MTYTSRLFSLFISLALITSLGCGASIEAPNIPEETTTPVLPWVSTPQEVVQLLEEESTLMVFDARDENLKSQEAIPGAVSVTWQQFSEQEGPNRGLLKRDLGELGRQLGDLGVSQTRRVIVLGNTRDGWGEAGRIVWMLRALGSDHASLVDGGWLAMKARGITTLAPDRQARVFEVDAKEELTATLEEVRAKVGQPQTILLDTRERREYDGEVPYGETRGGHLEGAKHLYFKELIDEQGVLLPRQELVDKLKGLGITPQTDVVAYCTGGIRSAWLIVVLRHLGYDNVSNYAGSMWEWSAQPASEYPLEME